MSQQAEGCLTEFGDHESSQGSTSDQPLKIEHESYNMSIDKRSFLIEAAQPRQAKKERREVDVGLATVALVPSPPSSRPPPLQQPRDADGGTPRQVQRIMYSEDGEVGISSKYMDESTNFLVEAASPHQAKFKPRHSLLDEPKTSPPIDLCFFVPMPPDTPSPQMPPRLSLDRGPSTSPGRSHVTLIDPPNEPRGRGGSPQSKVLSPTGSAKGGKHGYIPPIRVCPQGGALSPKVIAQSKQELIENEPEQIFIPPSPATSGLGGGSLFPRASNAGGLSPRGSVASMGSGTRALSPRGSVASMGSGTSPQRRALSPRGSMASMGSGTSPQRDAHTPRKSIASIGSLTSQDSPTSSPQGRAMFPRDRITSITSIGSITSQDPTDGGGGGGRALSPRDRVASFCSIDSQDDRYRSSPQHGRPLSARGSSANLSRQGSVASVGAGAPNNSIFGRKKSALIRDHNARRTHLTDVSAVRNGDLECI